MRSFLFAISMLFLTLGCGTESDTLQPILGSGNAHFRENSIGDSYKKVLKKAESDHLVSKDENAIDCELQIAGSEVIVRYEFDEKKLYSIQADIFFADSTTLNVFEEELMTHYNEEYGNVSEDGGFLVWKGHTANGPEVEFTLADESIEFGRPKLSLTIYNFDF